MRGEAAPCIDRLGKRVSSTTVKRRLRGGIGNRGPSARVRGIQRILRLDGCSHFVDITAETNAVT